MQRLTDRHAAFMALFVRHEPAIHVFLVSLLVDPDDAEVVMQETSMAMWRKFDQFQEGTSFRKWAFQIARFEAMNYRRKKARDRHVFNDELLATLAREAEEQAAEFEEERRALSHCIAKLREQDREVLEAAYGSEQTLAEYAAKLGKTPNAVRKHLARVRATLFSCVRKTMALQGH
ncbi:MAG: sigma-70 family RNA polymerase sigma factor [Planctomycetota bacterium]|nr:MAG: sigma-70 family RNA polymerase sigma factor [Planctomycetota bacterium]